MLGEKLIALKRPVAVGIISTTAMTASLLLWASISFFMGHELTFYGMALAILIPGFLSSISMWFTIGLLQKINRLKEELGYLATYDSLTGLYNRGAFLRVAESLYNSASRNLRKLAVVYIDIDDFKKINDNFGHAAGDLVLQEFGEMLNQRLRKSDVAGRVGGEEFVLLLDETDLKGALKIAEELRVISHRKIIEYRAKEIRFTVSIGITVLSESNNSGFEDLCNQADDALYDAKNCGKNRITSYDIMQIRKEQEAGCQPVPC